MSTAQYPPSSKFTMCSCDTPGSRGCYAHGTNGRVDWLQRRVEELEAELKKRNEAKPMEVLQVAEPGKPKYRCAQGHETTPVIRLVVDPMADSMFVCQHCLRDLLKPYELTKVPEEK
jgi:hypothetical protein